MVTYLLSNADSPTASQRLASLGNRNGCSRKKRRQVSSRQEMQHLGEDASTAGTQDEEDPELEAIRQRRLAEMQMVLKYSDLSTCPYFFPHSAKQRRG